MEDKYTEYNIRDERLRSSSKINTSRSQEMGREGKQRNLEKQNNI